MIDFEVIIKFQDLIRMEKPKQTLTFTSLKSCLSLKWFYRYLAFCLFLITHNTKRKNIFIYEGYIFWNKVINLKQYKYIYIFFLNAGHGQLK